ncbi:MAG: BMC domain-containing protein [Syntrophobacteraceae bacterium]
MAANNNEYSGDALGFVETMGLTAAIEVADAMGKAARVRVKSICNADAGLLTVICEGDIAACKAAVDAGSAAARRLNGFITSNLIARPYEDAGELITEHVGSMFEKKKTPAGKSAKGSKK